VIGLPQMPAIPTLPVLRRKLRGQFRLEYLWTRRRKSSMNLPLLQHMLYPQQSAAIVYLGRLA
jgi:hypothetical protein